jgi:hypothetical protein
MNEMWNFHKYIVKFNMDRNYRCQTKDKRQR